jgi:hypothetical protein
MPMDRIQLQAGMSSSQFLELYGTEEQCGAALEQTRWPDGFCCPQCGEQHHALVYWVATGAIGAGAAVISRLFLQERSWKQPTP